MAITDEKMRENTIRLLTRANRDDFADARKAGMEETAEFGQHAYYSPSRPFWNGFNKDIAGTAFIRYFGDLRFVEMSRPLPVDALDRFDLIPVSAASYGALLDEIAEGKKFFAASKNGGQQIAVAEQFPSGGGYAVTIYEASKGRPEPLPGGGALHHNLQSAISHIVQLGFNNELEESRVDDYVPDRPMPVIRTAWFDLSEHNVYMGSIRMADGIERLSVIDMDNRFPAERWATLGFQPYHGQRFDKGMYFLAGDNSEQSLKRSDIVKALNIPECRAIEVDLSEIERVFAEKCSRKFQSNLNAVTRQALVLGQNHHGHYIYESPAGRFARTSKIDVVVEGSEAGKVLGKAAFLRAENEEDLRLCAEGFLQPIRSGAKSNWNDLERFGRAVFGAEASAGQMHRLQEAVEAAAYRVFASRAEAPDERAFKLGEDFYYGLPVARMRTAESVYLQQYSTPLPMGVVAQRLLIGSDDLTGKTFLEPTAGNAGLVNLLPEGVKVCAVELDQNRVDALKEAGLTNVELGDATTVPFRAIFSEPDGFDYTIANPPFGQMEESRQFDKLKNVRRIDLYIALRTLQARKDEGRSVLIFGADSPRSDGTVQGGAKAFLNYIHDHYEVHGLTELDGRMYSRHGAGYNTRMMVIGAKRPSPVTTNVPEKLPILTSYDDLWNWAGKCIESYPDQRSVVVREVEPSITARVVAPVISPVFTTDANPEPVRNMPVPNESEPEPVAETPVQPISGSESGSESEPIQDHVKATDEQVLPKASEDQTEQTIPSEGAHPVQLEFDVDVAVAVEPWKMTGSEWAEAFQKTSREQLSYGVVEWYQEKAKGGDTKAVSWLAEGLLPLHRDVIIKALEEKQPVPAHVLAEYPDLMSVAAPVRHVNEFQAPYQPASKLNLPSAMVPINMAGSTYAALNALESTFGPVDDYVATKLRYTKEKLGEYFSAEQIDALALSIKAVDEGRGFINADQTGMGKGRFVAGMMRYARLCEQTPVFLTIKPELFTDIFRDIDDIGSLELFKKPFIMNDGVRVMKFGTESDILFPATHPSDRKRTVDSGQLDEDVDIVLATYSQFQRPAHTNRKATLLTDITMQGKSMLFLDESHVAAGQSNIGMACSEAVSNCRGVVYSSATPLKGISNFAIYNKIFPASVDLKTLPDTLKAGGEALQEAISANMAKDGVIIRREHDFSKLTFETVLPDEARQARNVELANKLAEILSSMAYLSGDVKRVTASMNKSFEKEWEKIPDQERSGGRMKASSMNFGSRLYSLNRQFLLGIKIDDAVDTALKALREGQKPVIAVENTGESLLRSVLARRAGIEHLEQELDELDERSGALSDAERARREELQQSIGSALRNVRLESPPQYRELLEIMMDRIGNIKVQGRYGDVTTKKPESEAYEEAEKRIRNLIKEFPELPLTPLDVIRHELTKRGFPISEVSGRKTSLSMEEGRWVPHFHPKADAVAAVAGFQNGKYDATIITRSGSTGISLHSTDRFDDSDIRQRNFIVLQKASNIAEFLQWLGRVNRKDQVCEPVVSILDSALPAELRLTMMHNAKLRKLCANTTSNRESSNAEGDNLDLLNEVGDSVALEWLFENVDMANLLDVDLPKDDEERVYHDQENVYINKLMGHLPMACVDKQHEILAALNQRFAERVEELEQRGENPFKIDVYEWGAKLVKEEDLQSGVLQPTGSVFDEAVKIVTVEYERDVYPIRADKLLGMIKTGNELYAANAPLDADGTLDGYREALQKLAPGFLRRQMPDNLRHSELSVEQILSQNDLPLVVKSKARIQTVLDNLNSFKPGAVIQYDDLFKGERKGVVTSVHFPTTREDAFMLSKYTMRVVFPGEDKPKDVSLATVINQGHSLSGKASESLDLNAMEKFEYIRKRANETLLPFDEAPDGKLTRRPTVLQGNIFRACELAYTQRLGAPILFTDENGNRQRAVLLKEMITPEAVKALPLGFDAGELRDYIKEFLRPDHPDRSSRRRFGALKVFDSAVKTMEKGDGIMLEVMNGGYEFRLTIPGSKARAGSLMTDGSIFDIGKKTHENSLNLKLSGTKKSMSVDVDVDVLYDLMRRMQANNHVGKFYVPQPDQDILATLKATYAKEKHQKRAMDVTMGA